MTDEGDPQVVEAVPMEQQNSEEGADATAATAVADASTAVADAATVAPPKPEPRRSRRKRKWDVAATPAATTPVAEQASTDETLPLKRLATDATSAAPPTGASAAEPLSPSCDGAPTAPAAVTTSEGSGVPVPVGVAAAMAAARAAGADPDQLLQAMTMPAVNVPLLSASHEIKTPSLEEAREAAMAKLRELNRRAGVPEEKDPVLKQVSAEGAAAAEAATAAEKEAEAERQRKAAEPLRYVAEIQINDSPARFEVTKQSFMDEMVAGTEVEISKAGMYCEPGGMLPLGEKRLHLKLVSESRDQLEQVVLKIQDVLDKAGKEEHLSPDQVLTEKIYIGIDPDHPYQVIGKVLGAKGSYLKHIAQQSSAKVFLRGKGSRFSQQLTADDPAREDKLHILIEASTNTSLERARELAQNLVDHTKRDYEARYPVQDQQPPQPFAASSSPVSQSPAQPSQPLPSSSQPSFNSAPQQNQMPPPQQNQMSPPQQNQMPPHHHRPPHPYQNPHMFQHPHFPMHGMPYPGAYGHPPQPFMHFPPHMQHAPPPHMQAQSGPPHGPQLPLSKKSYLDSTASLPQAHELADPSAHSSTHAQQPQVGSFAPPPASYPGGPPMMYGGGAGGSQPFWPSQPPVPGQPGMTAAPSASGPPPPPPPTISKEKEDKYRAILADLGI